jgi:hypothetical protein
MSNSAESARKIAKLVARPPSYHSRSNSKSASRSRSAARRTRRAPKLSARNSAEWKQAYQILNGAVRATNALSEGLPGSKSAEAKVHIRSYFRTFSNTHLGDKLRKFVMSDKFKTARFQTRGEYRDEIKAAVLKQIIPTYANYENI